MSSCRRKNIISEKIPSNTNTSLYYFPVCYLEPGDIRSGKLDA